jgi:hypothetical protein
MLLRRMAIRPASSVVDSELRSVTLMDPPLGLLACRARHGRQLVLDREARCGHRAPPDSITVRDGRQYQSIAKGTAAICPSPQIPALILINLSDSRHDIAVPRRFYRPGLASCDPPKTGRGECRVTASPQANKESWRQSPQGSAASSGIPCAVVYRLLRAPRGPIGTPIGPMARPQFASLVNPLAMQMLGESAAVEIQAVVL